MIERKQMRPERHCGREADRNQPIHRHDPDEPVLEEGCGVGLALARDEPHDEAADDEEDIDPGGSGVEGEVVSRGHVVDHDAACGKAAQILDRSDRAHAT